MTEHVLDKEQVGAAIGRIPSGVFVITAQRGEQKIGMLGSWVMQAGFEPPCLSVGVHPEREIYAAIQESGRFSVNVLSSENKTLMKAFSRYSPEQFDTVAFTQDAHGIALTDAVAVIHCQLRHTLEASDHHLLIGEIVAGEAMHTELDPMIHLRKSGFSY